jgi:hypothetical protein
MNQFQVFPLETKELPRFQVVVNVTSTPGNQFGSREEGGENVLRSVKILTYTFTWKATHLNFHVAVKYHNVLNL